MNIICEIAIIIIVTLVIIEIFKWYK